MWKGCGRGTDSTDGSSQLVVAVGPVCQTGADAVQEEQLGQGDLEPGVRQGSAPLVQRSGPGHGHADAAADAADAVLRAPAAALPADAADAGDAADAADARVAVDAAGRRRRGHHWPAPLERRRQEGLAAALHRTQGRPPHLLLQQGLRFQVRLGQVRSAKVGFI